MLGGFAMLLGLVALYLLPVFRAALVAPESDMAGPILGLVFFPMLLIAMGLRMTTNGENGLVSGVAMIGMIAGWALVGPSVAPLAPIWGVAGAALGLHLSGLLAISSAMGRGLPVLSLLTGVTAIASSYLASRMNSELFFVIGSV